MKQKILLVALFVGIMSVSQQIVLSQTTRSIHQSGVANPDPVTPLDIDNSPLFEQFGCEGCPPLPFFPPEGWKIIDVNHDGDGIHGQWHYTRTNLYSVGGAARFFTYDYPDSVVAPVNQDSLGNYIDSPSDDYFFTLPLLLHKDTLYNLSFWYRTVPNIHHSVAVQLAVAQEQSGIVNTLSDKSYGTLHGYQQELLSFTVPNDGVYYIDWWEHSPTNSIAFRLEDVRIEKAPQFDLRPVTLLQQFSSEMNRQTQYPIHVPSKKNEVGDDENSSIIVKAPKKGNRQGVYSGTHFIVRPLSLVHPQRINAILNIQNDGQHSVDGSEWDVQCTATGISLQIIQGIDIVRGVAGNISFSFLPPHIGTYLTQTTSNYINDGAPDNNTAKEWFIAYPEKPFIIDYDSSGNAPKLMQNLSDIPLTAGVRFTVPPGQQMRLAGISIFSAVNPGAITPQMDSVELSINAIAVDTSGKPDYTTIGPELFRKVVGASDYIYTGLNVGHTFLLPMDESNFIIPAGGEFILTVSFSERLGITKLTRYFPPLLPNHPNKDLLNRSYESTDGGITWRVTDADWSGYKWVMRAVLAPVETVQTNRKAGKEPVNNNLPKAFALYQNEPNPFNPTTTIRVAIPGKLDGSVATLSVYNILGEQVAFLLQNEILEAGFKSIVFDASSLTSGIYFYRITLNNGEFTATKKMVVLK